ncbi:MAG: hypothetical protein ACK56I_06090, partial [bacterium]
DPVTGSNRLVQNLKPLNVERCDSVAAFQKLRQDKSAKCPGPESTSVWRNKLVRLVDDDAVHSFAFVIDTVAGARDHSACSNKPARAIVRPLTLCRGANSSGGQSRL